MRRDEEAVPVFSTAKETVKPTPKKETVPKGPCQVRLDTKARRGKQVVIVSNIPLESAKAKELMRSMQAKLACTATFKDGEMLFNVPKKELVIELLQDAGLYRK